MVNKNTHNNERETSPRKRSEHLNKNKRLSKNRGGKDSRFIRKAASKFDNSTMIKTRPSLGWYIKRMKAIEEKLIAKENTATTLGGVLRKWGTGVDLKDLERNEIAILKRKHIIEKLFVDITAFCYYRETSSNVFATFGSTVLDATTGRNVYVSRSLHQLGGKLDKFRRRDPNLGEKLAEALVYGLKGREIKRVIVIVRSCFFWARSRRLRAFLKGLKKQGIRIARIVIKATRAHNGCRARKIRRM